MATANDRRDTSIRPPGSKYPWAQWQDGQWWTIEAGKDFDATIKAMRDQLHVRAKATSVKVRTRTDKVSKITFIFQRAGESDAAFEKRYIKTSS
jgi:hypothetical protein